MRHGWFLKVCSKSLAAFGIFLFSILPLYIAWGDQAVPTLRSPFNYERSSYEEIALPVPSQGIQSIVSQKGWRIEPTHDEALWSWEYSLTELARGSDEYPFLSEDIADFKFTDGTAVSIDRGLLTEWYNNTPRGVKQGFTIKERPLGTGDLEIRGVIETSLESSFVGANLLDFSFEGKPILRLTELYAYDAVGTPLPAGFLYDPVTGELSIIVDDEGAQYPIVIDPLATSPTWSYESGAADTRFGTSVARAGDVNGDGFSDVLVGAPRYSNGQTNEGAAYIFYGGVGGVSTTSDWLVESNGANYEFGTVVSGIGDVNNDGYDDVAVGAPGFTNGQSAEGAVFFFYGSASGVATTSAWVIESNVAFENLGNSISSAGDVNGDGYDDVLVGSENWFDGIDYYGKAYLYNGSASGVSTTSSWSVQGNDPFEQLGKYLSAGDINGDGFSDVAVGTTIDMHLFLGSGSGPSLTPDWTNSDGAYAMTAGGDVNNDGYDDLALLTNTTVSVFYGTALGLPLTANSNQSDTNFGTTLAFAGDSNGDGYDDLLIGAKDYPHYYGSGEAFLLQGSQSGMQLFTGWTAFITDGSAFYGASVAGVGDVNGDGYEDSIVGAPRYTNGETEEGAAFLYYGTSATTNNIPTWTAEANIGGFFTSILFGNSVASGDVNGDGQTDVIVGAPNDDNPEINEGRVRVYLGSSGTFSTTPDWIGESNIVGGKLGWSVASGDINNDGYDDVIAGAFQYSNGETREGAVFIYYGSSGGPSATPDVTYETNMTQWFMGHMVATGNLNNDAYDDVLVSVYGYTNGQVDEGAVYAYYGSALGPGATPDWIGEGNIAGINLGNSLAAGDINNDGYDDIIAGAPYYTNGQTEEGALYGFLSAGAPPSTTPTWIVEGGQNSAHLGGETFANALATVDINGDGYHDVIAGAPSYSNGETSEGGAFIYYGSGTTPATTPDAIRESDSPSSGFGIMIARAGDINNDGYDDVIVTAPLYAENFLAPGIDNGQMEEGRVYVFGGGGSGISSQPLWISDSNKWIAWLGASAAGLGDINGDSYDDLLAGAIYYYAGSSFTGAVFGYLTGGGMTVTQSGGTTNVTEGGSGDTFTVVLNSPPPGNVVVSVVSTDTGGATVSVASLTFTSGNWSTPQTVTVNPVDDVDLRDESVVVRVSINTGASHLSYDRVPPQLVQAIVTDDDTGLTVPPTVVSAPASAIGTSTVTLNGEITNTGGENPTVRGFNYGLTASYGSTVSESGSFGIGTFSRALTGLTCGTTYHFEAYATNSAGIGDSSDTTFTTSACPSTPTSTPTTTPTTSPSSTSSSQGSRSVSRVASTTPTTTPTTPVIVEPIPGTPPTVYPPVLPTTGPANSPTRSPSSQTEEASTANTNEPRANDLDLPRPASVQSPQGIIEEEISRESLAEFESTAELAFGTLMETLARVVNAVRNTDPSFLWLLSLIGLVSLTIRPLVTSLRIQSFRDALLAVQRLFTIVLPRRRRIVEPWGTVYDARTKRPLDPAYVSLVDVATGKEMKSAVTDLEGRYGFLMDAPGRYRIVPQKTHYVFPSRELYRNHNDYVYDNLYFGEEFIIDNTETVVRRNIPMDAHGRDWNEEEKVRMGIVSSRKKRQVMIHLVNAIFLLGFGYTLYAVYVSPNLWNSIMALLYVVIWTAEMLWKRHFHLTAVIRRSEGGVIPFALVKIYHPEGDIVVKQVVADMFGKFYCLIARGKYRVVVEERKTDGTYEPIHSIPSIDLKKGIFLKDIVVPR